MTLFLVLIFRTSQRWEIFYKKNVHVVLRAILLGVSSYKYTRWCEHECMRVANFNDQIYDI